MCRLTGLSSVGRSQVLNQELDVPDEAPLHRVVMVSLAGLSVEAGRKTREIKGGERVVRWALREHTKTISQGRPGLLE